MTLAIHFDISDNGKAFVRVEFSLLSNRALSIYAWISKCYPFPSHHAECSTKTVLEHCTHLLLLEFPKSLTPGAFAIFEIILLHKEQRLCHIAL